LGTYGIGGFPVDMKAAGDYLFLVTSRQLMIFPFDNFQNWQPVASINIINGNSYYSIKGLEISGDRAFITGDSIGLIVYDISCKSNPVMLGRYDTPGYGHGVAVVNDIAIVADYTNVGLYDCADATDIQPIAIIPRDFGMAQNYPNPFNAQTIIAFTIPAASNIDLAVYDLMGRRVEILYSGPITSGEHRISWDASQYSSGVYLYRLILGNGETSIGRMLLLK